MTPRPVYRWKSFWFGILVLGFLGFAWIESKHSATWCAIRVFDDTLGLGNWNGYVCVFNQRHFEVHRFMWMNLAIIFDPEWFPFPFLPGEGIFRVAHWFVIFLFLVLWLAFLSWCVRKQKKPSP
jgi:hypothetical protein